MQKIFVDHFWVPDASKAEFLESSQKAQAFIRTLPGFVEGFLFEREEKGGRYNFMTVAVWRDEAALEEAKKAVAIEFQNRGFDPNETRKRLNIDNDRGIYRRSPY